MLLPTLENHADYVSRIVEVRFRPKDLMKHNQQSESNQRQVVLSPHPPSPCSPPIQRTTVYQITAAPQELLAPRTNLPVALEAMSSVWIPQDPRLRELPSALPIIDGQRGGVTGKESRQRHQSVTVVPPPPRTGAKRASGAIRSCVSDSFLHSRVEPLYDGIQADARVLRGVVPTTQDGRRPSTPIVESATKAAIKARRPRYFSATDPPVAHVKEKVSPVSRSESPKKQPNRTKGSRNPSKGDMSRAKDILKDGENGSFCIWKEKTRSLRRASQTSSKMGEQTEPLTDGTLENSNKDEGRTAKREEVVLRHLNYCSSRKTNQVVKWLREVNLQDSFEIIE